ncbi:hypothetical protein CIPAW_07G075400 [Carya illinoinensis]|uniref:Secreted protein n=1 Tax=Carya illinoinensis TaxID=32201 RepID=A0A8T1PT97_CARIL|nr:hypothetical protein CIPAW_07G075400 [Carya illinoinensis]
MLFFSFSFFSFFCSFQILDFRYGQLVVHVHLTKITLGQWTNPTNGCIKENNQRPFIRHHIPFGPYRTTTIIPIACSTKTSIPQWSKCTDPQLPLSTQSRGGGL